jgi:hypothetical protein
MTRINHSAERRSSHARTRDLLKEPVIRVRPQTQGTRLAGARSTGLDG